MFKPVCLAGMFLVLMTAGAVPAQADGPDGKAPPMRPNFKDIDSNGDGAISPAEFDAFKPKGPHGPREHRMERRGPPDLKALDANGDGRVTLEEFSAPMKAHFDTLDANHDGVLDTTEMAAVHQGWGHKDGHHKSDVK